MPLMQTPEGTRNQMAFFFCVGVEQKQPSRASLDGRDFYQPVCLAWLRPFDFDLVSAVVCLDLKKIHI